MIVNFSNLDLHERPTLILKNAGDTPLGVLGHAYNIDFDGNYNEISVLTFNVPSEVDNETVPYYDDLVGMRVIELRNIGNFTLISPVERNDGTLRYKECQAYSLEYEFSYKKITVANDTYKFWDNDPTKVSRTILGMIMELMPSWKVARVSSALINKYRTFEVNNENLYNFIKSTIQESYGCIFDFNTLERTVTVRDVDDDAVEEPVYLSMDNLIKQIEIHEETENMVTRLDVSGADGVDIRDVNPTGTNHIINLDYYMNTTNFTQALIDKYHAWKTLCGNNRAVYYSKSVKYTLLTMQVGVERAALTDLQGELTNLDNQRAVIIQAISQGISTQSDLNTANASYNAKKSEIAQKEAMITTLEANKASLLQELRNIVSACSFNNYFTENERMELDRYIRDGEISESSFVSTTVSYSDDGAGFSLNNTGVSITGAAIERTTDSSGTIIDIRGGSLTISSFGSAEVISAVLSYGSGNSMVFTASLSGGTLSGESFESGSLTVSGNIVGSVSATDSSVTARMTGNAYFTLNPGEFQRRSVAWELFEYGEQMAERLSQPTFTFSVDSANFLALEAFEDFKNHLRLGEKIYLDNDGDMLKPICVGVHCNFDDLTTLELKFGDSFVRSDTAFKLADILERSVNTGRTVDAGKFNYEEFSKTGASTSIEEFMKGAIDLSKNKILESSQQAISMDGAGIRLRKFANEAETAYEDEQIWMNNNSVLMTDDNWQTAKMAIGKFKDPNFGNDLWGILAPTIVGTLLAGEQLVIESKKNDGSGDVLMFRVDGDGCRMYNGEISVIGQTGTIWTYDVNADSGIYSDMRTSSTKIATAIKGTVVTVTKRLRDASNVLWGYVITPDGTSGWMPLTNSAARNSAGETGASHIVLHPDVGIVVGKYPVITNDGNGNYQVNKDNASMWIDVVGNMYMNGYATFNSLSTPGQTVIDGSNILTGTITANQLSQGVNNSISTAQSTANSANYREQTIYISKASGTTSVAANTTWVADATGDQNKWTTKRPIYDSSYPVLYVALQRQTVSQSSGSACSCTTPAIDQTTTVIDGGHITTGTIDAGKVNVTNISASSIMSGFLSSDRINANSISVGKLTGTIKGGSNDSWVIDLTNGTMTIGNISASNITTGTLDASKITVSNLSANSITSGTLDAKLISTGSVVGKDKGYSIELNLDEQNIRISKYVADTLGNTWTESLKIMQDSILYYQDNSAASGINFKLGELVIGAYDRITIETPLSGRTYMDTPVVFENGIKILTDRGEIDGFSGYIKDSDGVSHQVVNGIVVS